MASIRKTPSSTWKAVVRKRAWPTCIKTFRTKRTAEDWARRTEEEMIRGVYIDRTVSEKTLLKNALDRYVAEVSSTKRPPTIRRERPSVAHIKSELGDYSLAALSPDVIASYRNKRLTIGYSASTVRQELALLSHLFTIATKEWRTGLLYNPVSNIRKPPPHPGRNRRWSPKEEKKLLAACDKHSNPMLGWIVRVALYTGMRMGEITSLRLDQIDLTKRTLTLSHTKNGSACTIPLSHLNFLYLTLRSQTRSGRSIPI